MYSAELGMLIKNMMQVQPTSRPDCGIYYIYIFILDTLLKSSALIKKAK